MCKVHIKVKRFKGIPAYLRYQLSGQQRSSQSMELSHRHLNIEDLWATGSELRIRGFLETVIYATIWEHLLKSHFFESTFIFKKPVCAVVKNMESKNQTAYI